MTSPNIAPLLSGGVIGSTNDAFVIAEWRDPGGPLGPPRLIAPPHLHRSDDEAWYVLEGTLCVRVGQEVDDEAWCVLEGTLCVRVGQEVVEARAGSAVFVPRGTPHTYWNPGPDPLRYLLVMTSNIYRMIQEIHAMHERTPAALRAVFAKYGSELLDA